MKLVKIDKNYVELLKGLSILIMFVIIKINKEVFMLTDIAPVDNANSEEVNHDEIEYSDRLEIIPPRRKQLKKANRKRSISSKLTKQLDELCEVVKNKDSYIRTDPTDCSVQEVIDKLATLLGCQPMSPLFKLGIRLFTKKATRETFVALSEPEYQLEWLKD